MKKIFFNALSYDHGGWFICEAHEWPYKNATTKRRFIAVPSPDGDPRGMLGVNPDPDVQALLTEIEEVNKQLHEELVKIAVDLKLDIRDWDGNPYRDGQPVTEVILEDEDGKKLMDALIALGWVHQFIPIGP